MFRICAVGVAMGNASQDVKEQATAVAPSNAEGGVAWAVRRYVLESTT
jgi:hydroxymethylpyrimidine pyrophosphatase-like HAD family hydrolase